MTKTRGYKTLQAQNLTQSFYPWGGSNRTLLMLPSDENVPDSVTSSSYSGVTGNVGSNTVVIDKTFVCPNVFDILSVIDGTAYGAVKAAVILNSASGSNDSAIIEEIRLGVLTMDDDGNSTYLTDNMETVWTGSRNCNGVGVEVTMGTMFWLNLNGEIPLDQRVGMRVQLYGDKPDTYASMRLYHAKNSDDTSITLPFVIS